MTSVKSNVVWIASYPKSGNTWFRLLLSCILNPERSTIDINNIDNTLIASNRNLFDRISGTNSSDLSYEEIGNIRPLVYLNISAESKNTIYMKVHDAWQKNSEGNELFPTKITKRAILIVRNPFDIVISFANHTGISIKKAISQINNIDLCLAGNQNKLSAQLPQFIGSWSEHYLTWAEYSGLNVFVIRYEDLILDPVFTFSKALEFLQIKATVNQVIKSFNMCSFEELQKQEKKFGFKEKPQRSELFFKTGKMNHWKEILSLEEVKSIVDNHEKILKHLNYSY